MPPLSYKRFIEQCRSRGFAGELFPTKYVKANVVVSDEYEKFCKPSAKALCSDLVFSSVRQLCITLTLFNF